MGPERLMCQREVKFGKFYSKHFRYKKRWLQKSDIQFLFITREGDGEAQKLLHRTFWANNYKMELVNDNAYML